MPVVAGFVGFALFALSCGVLVAQEFTQGFDVPDAAARAEDRWALVYLDFVPMALVTVSLLISFIGVAMIPGRYVCFAIGILVLWCGIAIRQWSHVTLGRFHDGVVTIHEEHEIVDSGPYRYVRHPMYAGSVVAFLGIGLALGTWPGLVLCVLGTLPGMVQRIRFEEQVLRSELGSPYEEFCEGRARLVPGVW